MERGLRGCSFSVSARHRHLGSQSWRSRHELHETHRGGIEGKGVVVVAQQGVSIGTRQATGGSGVGVHPHILLSCRAGGWR